MTRWPISALLVMGIAILLASGVATAATFRGNDNPNTIEGTDSADTIEGRGGGDTLYGRGGIDKVYGGPGKDKIEGNADADTIYGGEDPDEIDGGDGIDYVGGDESGDTIEGGADADRLNGDRGADTIKGGSGADTIRGGVEGDTIKAGPLDETDVDTLYGEDGNDTIDAANYPALVADNVSCAGGDEDGAIADPLDLVGDGCENVLRIEEKSGERVKGYFDKRGNSTHVEFDSYVDKEEEGPLGILLPPEEKHPYDRATTSVITLDDDTLLEDEPRIRIKLTVNPRTKTIKQRATTPEGSQKKLSDADRRAINKAGELVAEFLDRKGRDDCNIKNQETLVLRHFAQLANTTSNVQLNDLDKEYQDPENKCDSNQSGSNSANLSAQGVPGSDDAGPANVFLEGVPKGGTSRCVGQAVAGEAGFSRLADPARADIRYVPLQTSGSGTLYLPCDPTIPDYVTYDLEDGTVVKYQTEVNPGYSDFGACGSGYLQYGYTQDCLDHDACVFDTSGGSFGGDVNCGNEFEDSVDDFILSAYEPFPCSFSTTSVSRSPGTGGPGSPTAGGLGGSKQA